MDILAIQNSLIENLSPEATLGIIEGVQPQLKIKPQYLLSVFALLKNKSDLFFDTLSCITAVDNGIEAKTIDIIYHLYSIPFENKLVICNTIARGDSTSPATTESVCSIYKSANWHEREIFDLFGVHFTNHPDLRRILLPNDWEGFPLLKDYKHQEYYRGIKIDNSPSLPSPNA